MPSMDLTDWTSRIHHWSMKKGFWHQDTGAKEHASGSRLACLMLVTTELGEAAEAIRKGDEINFREEIADTLIRILDLCGGYGIDIEDEVTRKMAVNERREFMHGKTC